MWGIQSAFIYLHPFQQVVESYEVPKGETDHYAVISDETVRHIYLCIAGETRLGMLIMIDANVTEGTFSSQTVSPQCFYCTHYHKN